MVGIRLQGKRKDDPGRSLGPAEACEQACGIDQPVLIEPVLVKKPPGQRAALFVRLAWLVLEGPAQTCGRSARLGAEKRMAVNVDSALGSITSLMAVRTLSSMVTSANSGTQVTKMLSFLR